MVIWAIILCQLCTLYVSAPTFPTALPFAKGKTENTPHPDKPIASASSPTNAGVSRYTAGPKRLADHSEFGISGKSELTVEDVYTFYEAQRALYEDFQNKRKHGV